MHYKTYQDNIKRQQTDQFSFAVKKSDNGKKSNRKRTRGKSPPISLIQKRINDNMKAFQGQTLEDLLSGAKNNSPYANRFKKENHASQAQSQQKRNLLKQRELENLASFGGVGFGEMISNGNKTALKFATDSKYE